MTTSAIVGAGRGLGVAAARRFSRHGFDVALLARRQQHVDELAAQLTAEGITARGYAADVRDPASLTAALDRAAETLGPVEVMQYSPVPQRGPRLWPGRRDHRVAVTHIAGTCGHRARSDARRRPDAAWATSWR